MNNKQFKLMWCVIIAVVFVLAFPPRSGEPNFIFHRFDPNGKDVVIWIIEFIVLGVVSAGLWFTFQKGVKNE